MRNSVQSSFGRTSMLRKRPPYPPSPAFPRTRSVSGTQNRIPRCFMHAMPLMWIVWAAFSATLLALLLYRGTLTRYEEDHLFLGSAAGHQQQENDALLRKVARIQPLVKVFTGATCLLTAAILGTYV